MLFVVAFTINVNAQEVKPKKTKTEACCTKGATAEEKAKCKGKADCKDKKASCATDEQSKSLSNEKKSCKVDGSCCGGKKTSTKKS